MDGTESFVLQKGEVTPDTPTLTRVHTISLLDDILGQSGPRKRTLQRAMAAIGARGAGVIVLLINPRAAMPDSGVAEGGDFRAYGIGAQILADLGIDDMILLTNSHRTIVAIEGYGLNIVGEEPIPE